MPNNNDAAQAIATRAYNRPGHEIVKEIDLSDFEAFKDVPPLQVNLNVPGIFDVMLHETLHDTNPPRAQMIAALAVMTNIDANILQPWADPLLYTIFFRARKLYWDYWSATKKNSKAP
mgnify:CR=1 FL=1